MKSKILALLGSALISGTAMAGGYQVNLASQRQIGMGHTGTGLLTGTSSIFFNPGAMSHIGYSGITIGGSALVSKIAYSAPESGGVTARTDNPLGTPFQVYGVYNINEKFSAGLGVYTPFGSTVNWGDEWNGRFGLNQLKLQAIYVQPTVSYAITDKLGIGVGLSYVIGSVNLQRSLPVQNQDGTEGGIELDGGAESAFGFNAGIFFQPTEKFSIGVNYRSRVDLKVEGGDVMFSNIPMAARANFPEGANFDAELPMPSTLSVGIGFKPNERLTLAADISHVGWDAYEKLRFDFSQNVAGSPFSEAARNYDNAFIYRIGGEYMVNDALALRAGAYLDQTPVQDGYLTPETPDSDSRGLSAGIGYSVSENISIDASFLYINKKERTDAANLSGGVAGTYKSVAYIPGIGLNFKF
ncbi:outer membrane protein transport protein [Pontibacter sp. HSC-14F20]|uniref:OmpP1/FadL family transporter n=1 Tax=Pontibacter sp. HSC-14F20 TaxID=2864136 RepID=UPI001C73397B|nr:outer membrane protein transport protein [Pontibacter sp. HSC-14F20]MBX0334426.1 outer membrane protein transport protein [Pontibacter sp. HSC-14F20]